MKFLPYVLKHLRRNWIRTLSTVFAMSICIFLFCTLQTVLEAVTWGLQSANASRLVTRHALSLANVLPLSYKQRIADVEGVRSVAVTTWFGGSLPAKKEEKDEGDAGEGGPDFSNFFQNFAVDARRPRAARPHWSSPTLSPQDRWWPCRPPPSPASPLPL